jgi:hypothetical protein
VDERIFHLRLLAYRVGMLVDLPLSFCYEVVPWQISRKAARPFALCLI